MNSLFLSLGDRKLVLFWGTGVSWYPIFFRSLRSWRTILGKFPRDSFSKIPNFFRTSCMWFWWRLFGSVVSISRRDVSPIWWQVRKTITNYVCTNLVNFMESSFSVLPTILSLREMYVCIFLFLLCLSILEDYEDCSNNPSASRCEGIGIKTKLVEKHTRGNTWKCEKIIEKKIQQY